MSVLPRITGNLPATDQRQADVFVSRSHAEVAFTPMAVHSKRKKAGTDDGENGDAATGRFWQVGVNGEKEKRPGLKVGRPF